MNALVTSVPAYDVSLFSANFSTGDFVDAFGLPVAADTGLVTLAVVSNSMSSGAASQIEADFSGLF